MTVVGRRERGEGSASDEPQSAEAGAQRRPKPINNAELVGIVVAVVVGVVLRFITTSALWLDEALTVNISRLPVADIPDALRHDGHPPLYYFLLHFWMRAFGEGDFAVRSLSGVFAVAALPLAWIVGRMAGGKRAAAAMLVLVALSPFAIRYGTEARMYSLVMLLVLAGYIVMLRALNRPRPLLLVAIAAITGLLLLSHYWAMWFLASVVLVLLWRAWRNSAARAATVRILVAMAVGGLAMVPWLPVMLDQSRHTGTPWAAPVRTTTLITNTLADFGGGGWSEAVLLGTGLLFVFFLGLCGRSDGDTRVVIDFRTFPQMRREAWVIALTIIIATGIGYATHTTFQSRYAAVLLPIFLVVGAVGVTRIEHRVAADVVVVLLLLWGVVGGAHDIVGDRTQARVVANAIKAQVTPDDLVVICPDQLGPDLHRLLPASLAQIVYPTGADPTFVDWRDYADRNAVADPNAFADTVARRVKPGAQVWYVASGGYKTLEGQCEDLTTALGARLGAPEALVDDDSSNFFEHEALFRFGGKQAH